MSEQLSLMDDNPEYKAFVDKFKPKLTTDDCYTPPIVYDAIRDWVCKNMGLTRRRLCVHFIPAETMSGLIIRRGALCWIIHRSRS